MKIDHNRVKINHLQLVYRTEACSKWLLKLEFPLNNLVSIYVTRPVNETSERLKTFIKSCTNLNHLLLNSER